MSFPRSRTGFELPSFWDTVYLVIGLLPWLWTHRDRFRYLSRFASRRYVFMLWAFFIFGFTIYVGITGFTYSPWWAGFVFAGGIAATWFDIRYCEPKAVNR